MSTATQTAPESIIRKIQLLFNLASQKKGNDGASNEEEASAAMAKAQELLAKYNLDIAMVGSTPVAGGTAVLEENREQQKMPRTAQYKWQVKLAKTIAEANFCWHWVQEVVETERWNRHGLQKLSKPQRMKRHVILGKQSNRIVAEMMYGYLIDTIENILPFPNTERLSKAAQWWREGCIDRLCERIEEKARAMRAVDVHQTTESQCTAIALRSISDAEYAANYDARYGQGAWARAKAREAEWKREREEEANQPVAAVMVVAKPETDAQRRKREEKEERDDARWRAKWAKQDAREEARLNSNAYQQGRSKAEDIGLDSQLKKGQSQSVLGN